MIFLFLTQECSAMINWFYTELSVHKEKYDELEATHAERQEVMRLLQVMAFVYIAIINDFMTTLIKSKVVSNNCRCSSGNDLLV